MTQPLTAQINRDACVGHGRCYMNAPAVFDCDDDGFPVVIGSATTDTEIGDLQRAIANCPEKAITAVPA